MHTFTATQITALTEHYDSFYLLSIEHSAGYNFHLSSFYTGVTYQSKLYSPSDMLIEVPAPQLVSSVTRDLYKIVLADNNFDLYEPFMNGITGAAVEIRLCFVEPNGNPLLTETIGIYKGLVCDYDYSIDTADDAGVKATINCANRFAALDMTRPYYTSKDSMRQHSPNDTSFDQVFEGSGNVSLLWGKKS